MISFTTLNPAYERSHVNHNAILTWCRKNGRRDLSLNDIQEAFEDLVKNGGMKENSKAVVETPSRVTVRTDFQNRGKQPGYPIVSKDSLRKTIKSMTSHEFAAWLQESESNRDMFDALD